MLVSLGTALGFGFAPKTPLGTRSIADSFGAGGAARPLELIDADGYLVVRIRGVVASCLEQECGESGRIGTQRVWWPLAGNLSHRRWNEM